MGERKGKGKGRVGEYGAWRRSIGTVACYLSDVGPTFDLWRVGLVVTMLATVPGRESHTPAWRTATGSLVYVPYM